MASKSRQTRIKGFLQPCHVPKNARTVLAEAAATAVCKDLRPLRLFECEGLLVLMFTTDYYDFVKGMKQFCQALVDIAGKHGSFDVSRALPDHRSVGRAISCLTEEVKEKIKPDVKKIVRNI